jgi:hypothetical protein
MTGIDRQSAYALRAAEGFLASMNYYGQAYVPVAAVGGPATPTYYRNMLSRAVHALGDYAALSEVSAAATARDGHAFYAWNVYAEAVIARYGGTTP